MVTTASVEVPRVGVAAIVLRRGRVLLGERLGRTGPEGWQFPGGRLAFGEDFFACAVRETLEETGLRIECRRLGPVTSTLFGQPPRHEVTVFVLALGAAGEARVREPDNCAGWHWFAWEALPQPLFAPSQTLLDSGFHPLQALVWQ